MESRPPGNVEVKAKDFLQKCAATHTISGSYCSQQVRKETVQDLVNINLMRHAGVGRGKQRITDPFASLTCVAKNVKDRSQLSNNCNSSILQTINFPVKKNSHSLVTENKALLGTVSSVSSEEIGSLPDISLCSARSNKLVKVTRPCVIRTEQASDSVSKSHVTVVNCGSYHSLHETFKSENVPVCAMENFVKCDGNETENLTSTKDTSVVFISCKENVTIPVQHEVCIKPTEENLSRNKLEVGSNPSSLAKKSGVSQFDVNGNRVPEKPEKKVAEKYSLVSFPGNSSHFTPSATKQCELLQKPHKSVCVQSGILKDSSSLCHSGTLVSAAENCVTIKITGNPLKKKPIAFEVEKEADLSTTVKYKLQYKPTKPDSIRCSESVFPSLESSVSVERLLKGLGTIPCSKKLNLESCNLSKSPLGVEVICDNISESDTVASDSVSKMMFFPALPSSHCVQGKPDSSRFKPANDMSSENSSSSNSDLENLNSVPTNRKNNSPHAAAYPSQISTPQASYADVIRTPAAAVSKIHAPQGVTSIFPENSKVSESNVQPPLENSSAEKLQKKEEAHPMGSSEWIISRLSQLDVNTNAALNVNGVSPHSTPNGLDFVNPQPIAVSLEKPSFYHSGLQTNKNAPYSMSLSPVNLCSPNKVNNENRGLTDSNAEKLPITKASERMTVHSTSSHSVIVLGELSSQKLDGPANGRTDSLSSNPSSMSSSICDAFKYASSSSNGDNMDLKSKQPPVVIMDNFMPLENASGISFGIDYDEVMKLCSDSGVLSNSVPFCEHPSIQDLDKTSTCNDSCSKTVDSSEKQCVCAAGGDKSYACDESLCKKRAIVDCSKSTSRVTVAGKNLYWRDVEVNNQACDISSLVGFLSESWNAIEKSLKKGSNSDAKIKYFEPEHL